MHIIQHYVILKHNSLVYTKDTEIFLALNSINSKGISHIMPEALLCSGMKGPCHKTKII